MTIDEVIKRIKEKMACDYNISGCDTCNISSCEDRDIVNQIAEWLEELKDYRDKNKMVVRVDVENMDSIRDKIEELSKYAENQYNKALDDFTEKIRENISESLIWGMIADCFKYKNMNDTSDKIVDYVINTANEIAKQLKGRCIE